MSSSYLLSDSALTTLREIRRSTMPRDATVYRRNEVSDGAGGRTTQLTLIGTYKCAISPAWQPQEGEILPQTQDVRELYRLYIEYDCDLKYNDVLDVDGIRFEVVSVPVCSISAVSAVVRATV